MDSGVWPWIITPLFRKAQLGPPFACSPKKAVFDSEKVMGKGCLVEDMSKSLVEVIIFVVRDLDYPIFD